MTQWVGLAGITLAALSSLALAWQGLGALRPGRRMQVASLRPSVYGLAAGAALAMLSLELGLLFGDFSLEYVANHHRSGTPLIFTIATAWAALEGSIVLWGLVLAAFALIVFRSAMADDTLAAGALGVMGIVSLFFFGMMLTIANPFRVCVEAASIGCGRASGFPWAAAVTPAMGRGTNPLLQNHILMAIHPPVLYVGYVGLTVPFAYAMSSLVGLRAGADWLRRTRRATLVAWAFLTAGILLGGWWSYEVLGWGGYWAWDPVENASFMPWLVATAFIHSSIVQTRRGVLQSWNYVLVIATFTLTILGTFLTRSGVVASVHSFTQSPVGPAILGFLVVTLVVSFAIYVMRVPHIASAPRLDSLVSREGVFLTNNLLLSVFAFVVLAGTLFPLIVEAFQGSLVSVGQPFFDRWAIPLSFALLVAMGIGPVTPYRVAKPAVVWDRVRTPLRVSLAAGAAWVAFGRRIGWVIVAIVAGTFVAAVIVRHFVTQVKIAAEKKGTQLRREALGLIRREPGFWGGQISHLGVAVLAVGIAMSANLVTRGAVTMEPGDRVTFSGFELEYVEPFVRQEPNRSAIGAEIAVFRAGRQVSLMEPRLNQYDTFQQAIQTPAVYTTLRGDLYLSLTRIDGESLAMDMWDYPLQWMVWLGGLVTAGGAAVSLLAVRGRARIRREGVDA